MTTKLTSPTEEYIAKVQEAVKDVEDFKDEEDTSKLLAYSCWRHNWPLKKEYFEEETIQFSDDDSKLLDEFLDKLEAFTESQGKPDPDNTKFAEHATHFHGSFSHDHEGGNESHTHEGHSGTYSKTAPSSGNGSSNNSEEKMFAEQVRESLGLPKDATSEQVVGAIGAIKASSFTEEQKSAFQDMQHNYQVNQYMEETASLTAIPGTPKELAEKLTDLQEKTSPEIAKERLEEYKSMQAIADGAGVTSILLQSKFSESNDDDTVGPAEAEIKKYAEDNKITFNQALAQISSSENSKLFHAYYAEQNPTGE